VAFKIEKNTLEVRLVKDLFVLGGAEEECVAADVVDLASDALGVVVNAADKAITEDLGLGIGDAEEMLDVSSGLFEVEGSEVVADGNALVEGLVGAPADQAAGGLAVGMRAAVRDGEALTGEGNGFDVLLYRTGEVLYNDHDLGIPPLVVGLANLGTRRGVSSFLAQLFTNRWCATCWRHTIIPAYACDASGALLGRSTSLAIHLCSLTASRGRTILFGRDLSDFDQGI
jgi:hypothetical protein